MFKKEQIPVLILVVLAIVVLLIFLVFLNRVRQTQIDSFSADSELLSNPAPFQGGTVYDSLPKQYYLDSSYQYLAPYEQTCLGVDRDGNCQHGQNFNCYLNPHNQRYCYWK